MPQCEAAPKIWKDRQAFRLSNGIVEITLLLGGGHIADFRLCGSPYNALFESPWQTIEPSEFSPERDADKYGEGPVGRLLSGYTGHAVALGYFGMPSAEEAAAGLPLHGEAVAMQWKVVSSNADERAASATLEVNLPYYGLRFRRSLHLPSGASSVLIEEQLENLKGSAIDLQWVEHAAFGEPLFSRGQSRLFLSATRGRTWPLGYEGRELLPPDVNFGWPLIQTKQSQFDLSLPFLQDETGFLASLLVDTARQNAFIVVVNSELKLAVGYVFDPKQFPWIALWEENRARQYSPWNGVTRARGVEFGNTPMPLGLQKAREAETLFDTPTVSTLAGKEQVQTAYEMFVTKLSRDWSGIEDVERTTEAIVLHGAQDENHAIPTVHADRSG